MKRENRRAALYLSKETLVHLNPQQLRHGVRGGTAPTVTCLDFEGWSEGSVCPTTTPSNCRPCN